MPKKKFKEHYTLYNLFTCLSLAGIVGFFLFALIRGSFAFDWVSMRNKGGIHTIDYFNHVLLAAYPEYIYEIATGIWGMFPPLAYVFYRFLFLITYDGADLPQSYAQLAAMNYTLTVFLYYSLFVALLLVFAIEAWRKENAHYKRLVACLLLSVPFFAGGFERGNSVMVVVPLLLIALKWKDSGSRLKKELALVIIAICAGLKIYPAIFGLLYIKEQRFKEGFRLLGYGILFFFVPFLFFGGKNGLILWLLNVIETTGTESLGRLEYIKGLTCTLGYLITGRDLPLLGAIMTNLFLLAMIGLFVVSVDKYRTVFYLCCCMTFFPVNAHRYTLSYLAIPLVMYLMEHGSERGKDAFITAEIVGYGCLFSIPVLWGFLTGFRLQVADINPHLTYVELWLYVAAYSVVLTTAAHELYRVIEKKELNPTLKLEITRRRVSGKTDAEIQK